MRDLEERRDEDGPRTGDGPLTRLLLDSNLVSMTDMAGGGHDVALGGVGNAILIWACWASRRSSSRHGTSSHVRPARANPSTARTSSGPSRTASGPCAEGQSSCEHPLDTLPQLTPRSDGTLVTQRLHFAPMPHPHRHILGWHRILTELRDADIRAICVFDGTQRSAAKAREVCAFPFTLPHAHFKYPQVERRRESRKIDAARGFIETTRLHRLEKLMRLLPYYRSLPGTDRQRVNDALGSIRSPFDAHVSGSTLLAPTSLPPHPPSTRITSHPDHPSPPPQNSYFFSHGGMGIHDVQDVLVSVAASPSTSRSEPHDVPPSAHLDDATTTDDKIGSCDLFDDPRNVFPTLPFVHWNAAVQPTPSTPYPLPDSIESFQSELATLYSEYSQCITQLASMPASPEGPEIPEHHATPADSPDTLDARIDYAMSKHQLQMTLDEGHIWNFLSADVPPLDTESALMTLAERSTVISRSYQRRNNSPTTQTYDECKELLRAMGVPCIESTGPFEAEALACALVAHGHADYVVSEDTDVLVYEAPMLRGITARESPIVVVHGDAIRDTLQLDRASYVDFVLLLGTDFSQRIKHVGPNRALKFIREHGSIERVVAQESKYPPRVPVADYLAQVGVARLVFQNLPPLPDIGLLHQTEGDPNAVSEIIQRYRLHRMLPGAWDTESALAGNYFGDDPCVW
jgi:flap endonuclease-1